jgi:hypothetical protein
MEIIMKTGFNTHLNITNGDWRQIPRDRQNGLQIKKKQERHRWIRRALGKPRRRWEDSSEINVGEIWMG